MNRPNLKTLCRSRAIGAKTVNFGVPVFQMEIFGGHLFAQALGKMAKMGLSNLTAGIANQKLRAGMRMVIAADRVSIQTFDFVNKARLQPELYRAVNGWRLGAIERITQILKKLICAHRLVIGEQRLIDRLADRCEAKPLLLAKLSGLFKLAFLGCCHDNKFSQKLYSCKLAHHRRHASHDFHGGVDDDEQPHHEESERGKQNRLPA